jgi:peptidoglycan/LPS O-acetylase OafA/YrhL
VPTNLPSASPGSGYTPALDGLRAASILLVVAGHSGLDGIVPAGFGVTLFFFISGLLISRLLLTEYQRTGRIALLGFYLRRFLRLMPALYIYVAMSAALFAGLGFVIPRLHYSAALFYWANYYGVYVSEVHGGFAAVPHLEVQSPFAVLWSLAVEEHFYFLFPALLIVFRKRLPALLWTLAGLCALALIWRYVFVAAHCADPAGQVCLWSQYHNERATDTRFDSILFGVIATLLLTLAPARFPRAIGHPAALATAILLLLASFAVRDPVFRSTLRYTIQGLALVAIVPAILNAPLAEPVKSLLSWRPLLYLGRLSYSLYLFHWGAKNFASCVTTSYSWEWYAIFIPGALIPTLLCYHFVEVPIVGLRRRFGSHAPKKAIPQPDSRGDGGYAGSIDSRVRSGMPPAIRPEPIMLIEGTRS